MNITHRSIATDIQYVKETKCKKTLFFRPPKELQAASSLNFSFLGFLFHCEIICTKMFEWSPITCCIHSYPKHEVHPIVGLECTDIDSASQEKRGTTWSAVNMNNSYLGEFHSSIFLLWTAAAFRVNIHSTSILNLLELITACLCRPHLLLSLSCSKKYDTACVCNIWSNLFLTSSPIYVFFLLHWLTILYIFGLKMVTRGRPPRWLS